MEIYGNLMVYGINNSEKKEPQTWVKKKTMQT